MFTSTNPATGETIATYPELTDAEIDARVGRAVTAYRTWRGTALDERAALLHAIADQYDANRDPLARMASLEMGKTYKSALAEVAKCAGGFRHYAEAGPAMLAPRAIALSNGGRAEVRWLPQGRCWR